MIEAAVWQKTTSSVLIQIKAIYSCRIFFDATAGHREIPVGGPRDLPVIAKFYYARRKKFPVTSVWCVIGDNKPVAQYIVQNNRRI